MLKSSETAEWVLTAHRTAAVEAVRPTWTHGTGPEDGGKSRRGQPSRSAWAICHASHYVPDYRTADALLMGLRLHKYRKRPHDAEAYLRDGIPFSVKEEGKPPKPG